MIDAIHPDGVEKWAEWLDSQPKNTPMTQEQSKIFIACCMNEDKIENDPKANSIVKERSFTSASVFYNRVQSCHSYTISVAAAMFISTLIDNPGVSTIYANYIQYKAFKNGLKKVGIQDIAMMMPFGVFSKATLTQAWDLQKYRGDHPGSDNMLDYYEAQKSIAIQN